jgi:creatinine amidohydrolase
MMRSVWLQDLSWQEVDDFRRQETGPILIPVGSVEQHGLHLPVGTDSMVAIRLAEEAAQGSNAIVTPPIWFGWSPHHLALPGTISIRAEVLIEVVFDVFASLATHGFNRFIVINGHRMVNVPWLQIVAERAQRQLDVRVAIFDPAYMSKELGEQLGFGEIGHAEEIESSHMLHIMPHLVRMERATDYAAGESDHYHIDPRSRKDTLCYVPTTAKALGQAAKSSGGTGGKPSRSSREKGKALHDHLLNRLIEVIHGFQRKA